MVFDAPMWDASLCTQCRGSLRFSIRGKVGVYDGLLGICLLGAGVKDISHCPGLFSPI